MKIACASDIHGKWAEVKWPDAASVDVLVLAGDILANYVSGRGCEGETSLQLDELERLLAFTNNLGYAHRVIVPGNHDWAFYRNHSRQDALNICRAVGVHCLIDDGTTINGVKFWGSPWQPWFYDWAFNFPNPGRNLAQAKAHAEGTWSLIDEDTQVLVTHSPPLGIRDHCMDGREVGCPYLRNRLDNLNKLRLHVFGHIHYSAGVSTRDFGTTFVNAAILGEDYEVANEPVVITI